MPAFIPAMRLYREWLRDTRGLDFANYDALWKWSTSDLEAFWKSIWDYGDIGSPTPHGPVVEGDSMPGARWFPGARVNYAGEVLKHVEAATAAGMPAIIAENEAGEVREIGWRELRWQVASVAMALTGMGVRPGDRVVAYMPNVPETVVAFLATASIGAIWSVCSPDMAPNAVVNRFQQIAPKVLIAADGVCYAGKRSSRRAQLEQLRAALPSVEHFVVAESGHSDAPAAADHRFADLLRRSEESTRDFAVLPVPFDHPLWIVYSSGTTGLPKAIVHGHGGVLISDAAGGLHTDVGSSYEENSRGERFHWYSTTGWVMWNVQVAGLLRGTTICIFDGSPGGSQANPDWTTLWRFAARHRVTWFGAGAALYFNCMKAGVDLAGCGDLSAIRALGSTGSPLPEAVQRWGSEGLRRSGVADVWWCNLSGGTDLAACFTTGNRELPQIPGRMQCRQLGMSVHAWDDAGNPLVDEVGELVCTRPFPSMPLQFWGDEGGHRYHESYFSTYPGVWRHGDWLSVAADGSCAIHGRSDATINRHGLRLGTSEIYDAVESVPEVVDSMLIDVDRPDGTSEMLLFVVLRDGRPLDAPVVGAMNAAIRAAVSPRFIPDRIIAAPAVPRTISGKKQEVPIKRLFSGQAAKASISREVMANPECLDWYVAESARYSRPATPAS
jgi:acetoacetyl-CoA synthetase